MDYYKLRKIKKILKKVNRWKDHISQLTDQELQAKTIEFRQRLAQGETLDDLLPEAFAVAREADKRVLGMFPYDVQVMGGIVLHQGNVAEMNTGEGKTLTATMPVYLNALEGKGSYGYYDKHLLGNTGCRRDGEGLPFPRSNNRCSLEGERGRRVKY